MFPKVSLFRLFTLIILSALLAGSFSAPESTIHRVYAAGAHPSKGARAIHGANSVGTPQDSLKPGHEVQSLTNHPAIPISSSSEIQVQAETWQSWDILPSMSPTAISIYRKGQAMGNNPHAFSKIGDGEISAAWFLTDFDLSSEFYDLGSHSELQTTITYLAGSFGRQGMASRRGFNTQRVLDPAFADPEICLDGESPLLCETRLHRPAFALISMGTNQVWQPAEFESGLREIIETLISHGVVPILSTKADNLEGNHHINSTIARLAVEYDI